MQQKMYFQLDIYDIQRVNDTIMAVTQCSLPDNWKVPLFHIAFIWLAPLEWLRSYNSNRCYNHRRIAEPCVCFLTMSAIYARGLLLARWLFLMIAL